MENNTVEVFKTNISDLHEADSVIRHLKSVIPKAKVNIDLEDVDNILRVELSDLSGLAVKEEVVKMGFVCEVLE